MVDDGLERFTERRTALLTTFKRDGTPVGTPVTIAAARGKLYFRTYDRSGKAKRLRTNRDVEAAPSSVMGRVVGATIRGRARRLDGDEAARAAQLIDSRQPILQGRLVPLLHRLRRYRTLHYELEPDGFGG